MGWAIHSGLHNLARHTPCIHSLASTAMSPMLTNACPSTPLALIALLPHAGQNSSIGYSETTDSGIPSESMVPGCVGIRWAAGKSVRYALWKPVNGTCRPADCFGRTGCVVKEHHKAVPTNHMIPSLNLWWFGDRDAVATNQSVSVVVSDFKYFPESPAPTPRPFPPVHPTCCWSVWGDQTQCADYSGPGGVCNTEGARSCSSDSDCTGIVA